jgi:integrase
MSHVPMSDRAGDVLMKLRDQGADRPFEGMSRAIRILRKIISETCNTDPQIIEDWGRATVHSLRDTFVTRMFLRGFGKDDIASWVGHTSKKMIQKYEHLTGLKRLKRLRDMMERSSSVSTADT